MPSTSASLSESALTQSALSESERQILRAAAGAMIPPNPGLGMPGADDPAILADIERSIGGDLVRVREALAGFSAGRDVNEWYASGGDAAKSLGRVILTAYYRDDRVLVALGHEARAPFPQGYVVEQGDWSLLEAVKHRPQLWRDDRSAPAGKVR